MLLSLAIWLQNTALCTAVREAIYGYPTFLALHLTFIALFGAMIFVTDLRLLGFALRDYSIADVVNQLRIPKRIGFLLAATCGFLVFGTKSEEYYYNAFFRTKLVLFLCVAIHALLFRRIIYNHPEKLDQQSGPPVAARVAALTSVALWICIAIAGRAIGYIPAPLFSHHFTP